MDTPSHGTPSHGTPATLSSVSADESSTPPVVNASNSLQDPDGLQGPHEPQLLTQEAQEPQPEPELGPDFPVESLTKLDEQLSRPKWVVPVRPRDDLEMLLRYSIKLCKEGKSV